MNHLLRAAPQNSAKPLHQPLSPLLPDFLDTVSSSDTIRFLMPLFPDTATLPESKIRSGSVALLRLSIFSMRNIQKIHAPVGKIFPEKHCHFSEFRIYWEVYRSFLPAPQAGEFSSCTAASGGKQAGKAILPSPPFFAVFLFCRYSYFQRCHCSVFSLSRLCYRSGACAFGTAAEPAFALLRLL